MATENPFKEPTLLINNDGVKASVVAVQLPNGVAELVKFSADIEVSLNTADAIREPLKAVPTSSSLFFFAPPEWKAPHFIARWYQLEDIAAVSLPFDLHFSPSRKEAYSTRTGALVFHLSGGDDIWLHCTDNDERALILEEVYDAFEKEFGYSLNVDQCTFDEVSKRGSACRMEGAKDEPASSAAAPSKPGKEEPKVAGQSKFFQAISEWWSSAPRASSVDDDTDEAEEELEDDMPSGPGPDGWPEWVEDDSKDPVQVGTFQLHVAELRTSRFMVPVRRYSHIDYADILGIGSASSRCDICDDVVPGHGLDDHSLLCYIDCATGAERRYVKPTLMSHPIVRRASLIAQRKRRLSSLSIALESPRVGKRAIIGSRYDGTRARSPTEVRLNRAAKLNRRKRALAMARNEANGAKKATTKMLEAEAKLQRRRSLGR